MQIVSQVSRSEPVNWWSMLVSSHWVVVTDGLCAPLGMVTMEPITTMRLNSMHVIDEASHVARRRSTRQHMNIGRNWFRTGANWRFM
jgi:hypothetical protein